MDFNNDRVQKWYPGANYGVTVAATPMYYPYGMEFDRLGNIVIADTSYQRVISFGITCRKLSFFFKLIFINFYQ